MSDDIENSGQDQRVVEEDSGEDNNAKNSVPIISDKEIEAIFVGGVPAEADESSLDLIQATSSSALKSMVRSKP